MNLKQYCKHLLKKGTRKEVDVVIKASDRDTEYTTHFYAPINVKLMAEAKSYDDIMIALAFADVITDYKTPDTCEVIVEVFKSTLEAIVETMNDMLIPEKQMTIATRHLVEGVDYIVIR